jgi:Protein of unknown function (DUF2946)
MKWFRSNIKHGARFALFALAVQIVLSFGHFHAFATQAPTASQSLSERAPLLHTNNLSAADAASQSAQPQSPSNHDSDQPGDLCAVCAVIALANTALFATPPVVILPQAVELLYLTTDAAFVHLNSSSPAFQPRAPPLS